MVLVMLMGGLGNQMFQYALGKYLADRYNTSLYINISLYEDGLSNRTFDLEIFRIKGYLHGDASDIDISVTMDDLIYINESDFNFDDALCARLDPVHDLNNKLVILNGYWQSYKYFSPIDHIIRNEFRLKKKLGSRWKTLNEKLVANNSVMVNIRHGDYLEKLDYHGVVSEEYLNRSINYCSGMIKDAKFFVFSDDIPWCRAKLSHIEDLEFVDESFYDEKYQYYFQLMRNCKHFILANSSFCWWAAYLGQSDESIVIYPKRWFAADHLDISDLIPEKWLGF